MPGLSRPIAVSFTFASTQICFGSWNMPMRCPTITCSPACDAAATSAPAFTITFTATGSQLSDGNLTLTSDGVKSPSGKW